MEFLFSSFLVIQSCEKSGQNKSGGLEFSGRLSVLCSEHFTADSFEVNSALEASFGIPKHHRLKPDSVITVFSSSSTSIVRGLLAPISNLGVHPVSALLKRESKGEYSPLIFLLLPIITPKLYIIIFIHNTACCRLSGDFSG